MSHLMLKCRKWRRERKLMLSTLASKKIEISARTNGQDLETLFEEVSIEAVLRFMESTSIGKRVEAYDAQRMDEKNIERLDSGGDKDDQGECETEGRLVGGH
jgi:hypothetical protein